MNNLNPKFKIGEPVYWEISSGDLCTYTLNRQLRINYRLTNGGQTRTQVDIFPSPDDTDDTDIVLFRGMGMILEQIWIPPDQDTNPELFFNNEGYDQASVELCRGDWIYKINAYPCINSDALVYIRDQMDEEMYLKGRYSQPSALNYLNYKSQSNGLVLWLDKRHIHPKQIVSKPGFNKISSAFIAPDPDSYFDNLYWSNLMTFISQPVSVRDYALSPSLFSIPQIYTQYAKIVDLEDDLFDATDY